MKYLQEVESRISLQSSLENNPILNQYLNEAKSQVHITFISNIRIANLQS